MATSKLNALWNHPAGPKTIHFWAPTFKWGISIANIADFAKPPEKLSYPQQIDPSAREDSFRVEEATSRFLSRLSVDADNVLQNVIQDVIHDEAAREECLKLEQATSHFFSKLDIHDDIALQNVIQDVATKKKGGAKKGGKLAQTNPKKKGGKLTQTNPKKKGGKLAETNRKEVTINSRCYFSRSLRKLQHLIQEIHHEALGDTPFSLLFKILWEQGQFKSTFCQNYLDLLDFIITKYNSSEETFTINGHTFGMDVEDVRSILGISDGDKKFEFARSTWYTKQGLNLKEKAKMKQMKAKELENKNPQPKLTTEVVHEMMNDIHKDKDRVEDFTRLACLYVICTCFDSNSNGNLSLKQLDSVQDLKDMKTINWSSHILEVLKNELKKEKTKSYNGCTILLPFLVCEKAEVIKPVNSFKSPKYLNWNLSTLRDVLILTKDAEQPGDEEVDQSDDEEELIKREATIAVGPQENVEKVDPKENLELEGEEIDPKENLELERKGKNRGRHLELEGKGKNIEQTDVDKNLVKQGKTNNGKKSVYQAGTLASVPLVSRPNTRSRSKKTVTDQEKPASEGQKAESKGQKPKSKAQKPKSKVQK